MKIVKLLKDDNIVALNSDTISGLFVKYNSKNGLDMLVKLKKRENNPVFQVYISSFKMLTNLGVSNKYVRVLKQFLPGPYTIIVPTTLNTKYITKDSFIGIRFINKKSINKIIEEVGPLAATSLNISGKAIKDLDYYKKRFKKIFFGNIRTLKRGLPSTIIKIDKNGNYEVLRMGKGKIENVINVNIVIGSDHGGFKLKEYLKKYLIKNKITYLDVGTHSENSVDYPDYAQKVARIIQKGTVEKGILICGTGIGMSIAANRFKKVRAALCHSEDYARLARQHNNANILALGGRFIDFKRSEKIVNIFLNTAFDGGRHLRRIKKIEKI